MKLSGLPHVKVSRCFLFLDESTLLTCTHGRLLCIMPHQVISLVFDTSVVIWAYHAWKRPEVGWVLGRQWYCYYFTDTLLPQCLMRFWCYFCLWLYRPFQPLNAICPAAMEPIKQPKVRLGNEMIMEMDQFESTMMKYLSNVWLDIIGSLVVPSITLVPNIPSLLAVTFCLSFS